MYTPSREEARRFIIDAWAKHRAGRPLQGLERTIVDVVGMHPEYHALLDDPARSLEREWTPESGATNPFLHLSLHLAVAEQLAIDQPPGIRTQFERLHTTKRDEHAALHAVLECLGEVVWQSQRLGTPPDAALYLDCLARQR
jgi:hypothetical protein